MKKCVKCGAELPDNAKFCAYCGTAQETTGSEIPEQEAADAVSQGNAAQTGYGQEYDQNYYGYNAPNNAAQGYYYDPNNVGQGYYDPNNAAQGYYYDPNNAAQGYYYDPNNAAQSYYGTNQSGQNFQTAENSDQAAEPKKSKKVKDKKSKKSSILAAGIAAAVVVIAVLFFLIFGRGMIAKQKIKTAAEDYAGYIEDLNVKGLVKATAPKDLIKEVAVDIMRADGEDLDDIKKFRDEFDDEYDELIKDGNDEIEDEGIKVSLDDFKVKKVKKTDVKDLIQYVYDELDEKEIEGYDVDKVYAFVEEKAKDYNLDLNKIYRVDISYDLSVKGDYFDWKDVKAELKDQGIDGNDLCDHFYAYEYEGEYYIIPGVEDAMLPAFKSYLGKSKRSGDISSANSIYTAICTALSEEAAYDSFYNSDVNNEYITLSENGMTRVPEAFRKEFDKVLGDYPEVRYVKDGYNKFAFKVDVESGKCAVYVTNGFDYVEISPNTDYDFYN